MYKILGISLLSLTMTACSNAQEEATSMPESESSQAESNSQKIVVVTLDSPEQFKELMKNESAQLVDVRTREEYAAGKIGEAQNMNFFDTNFQVQLQTLDKNQPVLVYCASGGRSAKAVKMLKDLGFSEIHELKGGYKAWN